MLPEWAAIRPDTLVTVASLLVLVPLSALRVKHSSRAMRYARPLPDRGRAVRRVACVHLAREPCRAPRAARPAPSHGGRGPFDRSRTGAGAAVQAAGQGQGRIRRIRQLMAAYAHAAGMRSLNSMAMRGTRCSSGRRAWTSWTPWPPRPGRPIDSARPSSGTRWPPGGTARPARTRTSMAPSSRRSRRCWIPGRGRS